MPSGYIGAAIAAGDSTGWPTPSYTLGTAAAISVQAGSPAHTYGSWVELVASTAHATDILWIHVVTLSLSGQATAAVLSIGTGAAASEVELFAIPVGSQTASGTVAGDVPIPVPVHVATGTRIAARLQCETATTTATIRFSYSAALATSFATAVDVFNVNLATSRGVNMPTSNTYVELVSSTARDYQGLVMVPSAIGGVQATESSLYTVGVGAVASEVAFGSGSVSTTTTEQCGLTPSTPPLVFLGHIPSGSRLACKQSTGRNYRDVAVIGIRYP